MTLKYCTLIYKKSYKDKQPEFIEVPKVRCYEGNVFDSVYYNELEKANERLTSQITVNKNHFNRNLGTLAFVEMNGLKYKVSRTQELQTKRIMIFLAEV